MRSFAILIFLSLAILAPCRAQVFSDFTTPLPLKPGNTLIVGFLGGWERWDDPNRGVRELALKLREDGHPGLFVETVSNHERRLALELIRKAFDWNRNRRLDPDERAGARIILYGQSLGGS